jgi:hypothetical protein
MAAHMTKTVTDIPSAAAARETKVLRDARLLGTHLMGTCRMGNDPKTSVCNPFGQTHDIKNLFLADASVFPTATPANPTLTIQALSTRLALHINDLFSHRNLVRDPTHFPEGRIVEPCRHVRGRRSCRVIGAGVREDGVVAEGATRREPERAREGLSTAGRATQPARR